MPAAGSQGELAGLAKNRPDFLLVENGHKVNYVLQFKQEVQRRGMPLLLLGSQQDLSM